MAGRAPIATLLLCVVIGAGIAGPGDRAVAQDPTPPETAPLPPPPASFAPALSRIVHARYWHTRFRPARNTNARRIGRSLASLRPTWVTGTLRYARNQYPKRRELRAWKEIRRIVWTTSPDAQFDVVLNAEQYRTPKAVRTTMRRLRAKLGPEGWFFDFFSTAFHHHPRMVKAAINSAHGHGEWVGGNVFGLASFRPYPLRADFWAVQDHVFDLNLPAVHRLSRKRPVMYHLHNEPEDQRSGGCRFIERFNTHRRRRLIKRRAQEQPRYGFRVSYPVLYPECLHARPRGPGNFLYSYNAFRDPPVAQEIGRMLDRYDFDPAT
jgi:hypothetical protein